MATVHVLDHPLIQHKLSILRNKDTSVKDVGYFSPRMKSTASTVRRRIHRSSHGDQLRT